MSLSSALSSTLRVTPPSHGADRLLSYLLAACHVECGAYEQTSLLRRLSARMFKLGLSDFDDYREFLIAHPQEFVPLLRAVRIGYTAFFRDAPLWAYVAREIVPRLLALKSEDDSIRVWCAGCSSGEEAYTIAIVLAEALGKESFLRRVKVYASDISEEALLIARLGRYKEVSLRPIAHELRSLYFHKQNDWYEVDLDLRRSVIFSRHDLLKAPPISRVDLLICRNILIYLIPGRQSRVLADLYCALHERGFLVLGRAEWCPGASSKLFRCVEVRHRIFAKAKAAIGGYACA